MIPEAYSLHSRLDSVAHAVGSERCIAGRDVAKPSTLGGGGGGGGRHVLTNIS
jgi:hypothetical protein